MYYDSDSSYSNSQVNVQLTEEEKYRKMSYKTKRLVDFALSNTPGLSGKRCLISNVNEACAVEYVRLVPLSAIVKDHLLDKLEFTWNMGRYTCNLDTRYNIIRVNATLRELFDNGKWLLLPEPSILEQYLTAKDKHRSEFPVLENGTYRYVFLALPDMLQVGIHRKTFEYDSENPDASSDIGESENGTPTAVFQFHPYPYRGIPTVVSHAHPRFVIANAGGKIEKGRLEQWIAAHPEYAPQLENLYQIWKAWSKRLDTTDPETAEFLSTKDPNAPSMDGFDDEDNGAEGPPASEPAEDVPPPPPEVYVPLDKRALRQLADEPDSPHHGRARKRPILNWLSRIEDGELPPEEIGDDIVSVKHDDDAGEEIHDPDYVEEHSTPPRATTPTSSHGSQLS